jgi:hypothetical protein
MNLPIPPFPADHDEVAASHAVSRGEPGCGCYVCVSVVGPQARAAAARAEVAAMAERSARAAKTASRIEEVDEVVIGRGEPESESEYVDAASASEGESEF